MPKFQAKPIPEAKDITFQHAGLLVRLGKTKVGIITAVPAYSYNGNAVRVVWLESMQQELIGSTKLTPLGWLDPKIKRPRVKRVGKGKPKAKP